MPCISHYPSFILVVAILVHNYSNRGRSWGRSSQGYVKIPLPTLSPCLAMLVPREVYPPRYNGNRRIAVETAEIDWGIPPGTEMVPRMFCIKSPHRNGRSSLRYRAPASCGSGFLGCSLGGINLHSDIVHGIIWEFFESVII